MGKVNESVRVVNNPVNETDQVSEWFRRQKVVVILLCRIALGRGS